MKPSTLFASLAIAAATGVTALLAVLPVYASQSCTSTGGETLCTSSSSTLLEETGPTLLLFLTIPVLITVLGLVGTLVLWPLFVRWLNAGVFVFLCVLTGLSIGLLYFPAALLLLVSVALTDRNEPVIANSKVG